MIRLFWQKPLGRFVSEITSRLEMWPPGTKFTCKLGTIETIIEIPEKIKEHEMITTAKSNQMSYKEVIENLALSVAGSGIYALMELIITRSDTIAWWLARAPDYTRYFELLASEGSPSPIPDAQLEPVVKDMADEEAIQHRLKGCTKEEARKLAETFRNHSYEISEFIEQNRISIEKKGY